MNSSEGVPVAACTAILPLTALSQLFGEHHRRVLAAVYRITGSMADAEDVTQAVFLRLASADGPVTNASSYLYRAAINGALDVLRICRACSGGRAGQFAGDRSVEQAAWRAVADCNRRIASAGGRNVHPALR
jgi:RNA polymerase sigma-70 factor (ECF subfamily)